MKRATITVDCLAEDFFSHQESSRRRDVDILAELQEHLQYKGDDPRYSRVIFALTNSAYFFEITEETVSLAGVFPRISRARYNYGADNRGLRNAISIGRDTLVVVDHEPVAELWETELKSLEYEVRRL